jgi:putative hemolysin
MTLVLSNYLPYLVFIFFMMLLLFFFSGIETALLTTDRIGLEKLAKAGSTKAKRSLFLLDNIEDAMSMTQIGVNLVEISATSFLAFIALDAFLMTEPELLLVTAVQTIVFLIACELSPKVIARAHAETFLMIGAYPMEFLMFVLRPVIRLTLVISVVLKKIFKVTGSGRGIVRSRDEIDTLFRIGEQEGVIDEEHLTYVSEILTFKDIIARQIMTPTIDIMAVEKNQSIRRLVDTFVKTRFSRIPVYDVRVDNLIGYVFYRDVLKNRHAKKITDVMNKTHYVPSTKNIFELYNEMMENLIPMVFVANEYGAVVGMVTHEDIAEEVVGEIQTSEQSEEELIVGLGRGRFLLSGKLDIEYFMKRFDVAIDKKDFETLSGFITSHMGKIPKKGDRLQYHDYTFIIEEATDRSIEKVILQSQKKGYTS